MYPLSIIFATVSFANLSDLIFERKSNPSLFDQRILIEICFHFPELVVETNILGGFFECDRCHIVPIISIPYFGAPEIDGNNVSWIWVSKMVEFSSRPENANRTAKREIMKIMPTILVFCLKLISFSLEKLEICVIIVMYYDDSAVLPGGLLVGSWWSPWRVPGVIKAGGRPIHFV